MTNAIDPARVIFEARKFIGTPYHHQAALCGVGCDCLGLVRGVWRGLYGFEPESPTPYERSWAIADGDETLRDAARRHLYEIEPEKFAAGDVLLFRWRGDVTARHLGIATSLTHMIHAHEGAVVAEVPIGLWRRKIAFAFQFPASVIRAGSWQH